MVVVPATGSLFTDEIMADESTPLTTNLCPLTMFAVAPLNTTVEPPAATALPLTVAVSTGFGFSKLSNNALPATSVDVPVKGTPPAEVGVNPKIGLMLRPSLSVT
jgi:hypothetical protein